MFDQLPFVNIYIADEDSYAILKVDTSGVISVAAGVLNSPGSTEGALGVGRLSTVLGVAVGTDGSLYVADYGNARVRKVVGGVLSTLAGGGASSGTDAQQHWIDDICVDVPAK